MFFEDRHQHIKYFRSMNANLDLKIFLVFWLGFWPTADGWPVSLGCYESDFEFGTKLHRKESWPKSNATIELCITACRAYPPGFRFAAVGNGFHCHCSDIFIDTRISNKCNTPCYGNGNQICGGADALNIFTVCPNGTFGIEGCLDTCQCQTKYPPCHQTTGRCPDDVCATNFTGSSCDRCEDGMYSSNCSIPCGECIDAVCNRNDGSCSNIGCKAGFQGSRCDLECGNCINTTCTRDDGTCLEGCQTGYHGVRCDLECGKCVNETCKRNDGTCLEGCKDGQHGITCHEVCSSTCLNEMCNQTTGLCFECEDGYYGPFCNETCDEIGKCPNRCHPGYTGYQCLNECWNDTDGINCTKYCGNCTTGCHHKTGICKPGGCIEGYKGVYCDEKDHTKKIIMITMICLGCTGFFACIIICKCRIHGKCTQGPDGQNTCTVDCTNEKKTDGKTMLVFESKERPYTDIDVITGQSNQAFDLEKESLHVTQADTGPGLPSEDTNGVQGNKYKYEKDDDYENSSLSKRIPIHELEDYIENNRNNKIILNQFNSLEGKDRYRNIKPDNHNCVHQDVIDGTPGADFINASFISGYDKMKKFIAAQGPKVNTSYDHWRMIWEQNAVIIVEVTNLQKYKKDKCDMYWPDSVERIKVIGNLRIVHEKEEDINGYVLRTFRVMENDKVTIEREIKQFHFTGWPDKGIPDEYSKFNQFLHHVRNESDKTDAPIVVHCSAGEGRTGTFIAMDILTDQAEKEGAIDVYKCVNLLRNQRVDMVQAYDAEDVDVRTFYYGSEQKKS